MTFPLFLLLAVNAVLLFSLPRRWAWLPLIVAALYMGCYVQLEVGPAHLSASRILVFLGLLRVVLKHERIAGGWNTLDRVMLIWASWMLCSSIFHASGALIFRLGMVLDTLGVYFLFRVFVQTPEDLIRVGKTVCILLIPLAAALAYEKATGNNYFDLLGGSPGGAEIRNGHYRARGPFGHQILSGTVGAVCIPLALFLWDSKRKLALAGLAASGVIVISSGSSGPVLTSLAVFFAMALWKFRDQLRAIRWLAVLMIIALHFVMNDPVYYLMAKIDITGGSTGWHRAALIDAALQYLGRWWFAGTDYTRDWMPSGIPANANSTDITNHFLAMGVWGGLPLMLLFIWAIKISFAAVGRFRSHPDVDSTEQYLSWTLGAILFGHAITFMSISYFDQQSLIFLHLVLAAIGSVCLVAAPKTKASKEFAPVCATEA